MSKYVVVSRCWYPDPCMGAIYVVPYDGYDEDKNYPPEELTEMIVESSFADKASIGSVVETQDNSIRLL